VVPRVRRKIIESQECDDTSSEQRREFEARMKSPSRGIEKDQRIGGAPRASERMIIKSYEYDETSNGKN